MGGQAELTIDTDDGEDEPTFKCPEVPAGRVSPVLTASGSLPSFQPPSVTPVRGVAPVERLNPDSLGEQGSKVTVPPPSKTSTPVEGRTTPTNSIDGVVRPDHWGGGKTVTKSKQPTPARPNRRKQTLPSKGKQPEDQIA